MIGTEAPGEPDMGSTVEASEGLTPMVVSGLLLLFEHMFERPDPVSGSIPEGAL